jgi:SAM-dependent methyltransferase
VLWWLSLEFFQDSKLVVALAPACSITASRSRCPCWRLTASPLATLPVQWAFAAIGYQLHCRAYDLCHEHVGHTMSTYRFFYDEGRTANYSNENVIVDGSSHSWYCQLKDFVERYALQNARCLEIGSGTGLFQDLVDDYWGTDIAPSLARHYHKPYRVADGASYPFADEAFDAIWTITVFEHIPDLQTALLEIVRILRPGGMLLFAPAWQCRSWATQGYTVRPYSDFDWRGKLLKASIPLRNSVLWRSVTILPKRAVRQAHFACGSSYQEILYTKLTANYEKYWTSDSDACNAIDPHDIILWFLSHGFTCLSHPSPLSVFLVRTGGLIFQKTRN